MSYWKKSAGSSMMPLDVNTMGAMPGRSSTQPAAIPEFYEIEPGLVLDIILNKEHPYFKGPPGFKVDADRSPKDVNGKKPLISDPDYSWMGKALIRLLYTQRRVQKEDLVWASPAESNISEYPLLNEVVEVIEILGSYYYRRKVNRSGFVNANPDFNTELVVGGFRQTPNSVIEGNRELQIDVHPTRLEQLKFVSYQGAQSKMNFNGDKSWAGALGRYFLFNERIRSLKRREGDLIFESRFGQSIRFAAYDDNRDNDKSVSTLTDYYRTGEKYSVDKKINIGRGGKPDPGDPNKKVYEAGGGNPMILIRNRQRPVTSAGKQLTVYTGTKVPPVTGTEEEKNAAGYIEEDINNDGSSIHITSGATISNFVTTCLKKMWGDGSEEQGSFNGSTSFTYPKPATGDQIVINSDRIMISAKANEMFHFSKKRMAFVTDDEYTVDSHNQIVFTTNNKTVFNSPAIYLGQYDETGEPVLLGQTSVNWLFQLCNWLMTHTHWYYHSHPDAGQASPEKTQTSVQVETLKVLQSNLQTLLSRRVFVTGGGFAPGADGESLK